MHLTCIHKELQSLIVSLFDSLSLHSSDKIEAIIMRYPKNLNKDLDDTTNINANSASFDFLEEEPDIYSVDDLKEKYA